MQAGRDILERAGRFVGKRQVRLGTNATVMTIIFIAILVIINLLAIRYHVRWDLTEEGAFSLSPETIEIIEKLDQPISITGFFVSEQVLAQDDLDSRLQEYASRTNLISYEFVDPDTNPVRAAEYGAVGGTIVVESGEQRQTITGTDEQTLTGAILNVTRETPTTVYFLTGHGERSIDGFDQLGFGEVRRVLEQDNFIVAPISLVISDTVPLENSVLVVADPTTEFQEREEQAIADYVASGGRLLLLSNPLESRPLTNVMEMIGLAWNDDFLIDSQSEPNNPATPFVIEYPFNPITTDLANTNVPTLFPSVRTITQTETLTDVTVTPLLTSSPESQAVTDFSDDELRPGPDDALGPLTFGYSVQGDLSATGTTTDTVQAEAEARIVVIGDADFASTAYLSIPGIANVDFFRSTITWLAAQEDDFTLPPRPEPANRSLVLSAGQSQFVFFTSTFGIPLLVIIAGVWVWWDRR